MKKILLRAAALLLALVLAGCGTASPAETVPTEADKTDDNYRVFYEIFVGSFADSDGDGTGDLNGILRHLDYLNDGNLLSDTPWIWRFCSGRFLWASSAVPVCLRLPWKPRG